MRETLLKHAIALNNPHELGENVVPVSDIEAAPAADLNAERCERGSKYIEQNSVINVRWERDATGNK